MQVCIHCLLLILVLITQTHIFYRTPVARQSFQIAVLFCIKTIFFNYLKQPASIIQGFRISRRTRVLTQPVNGKANGINLLLGIKWIPFTIQFPINTPKLCVIEMINQITFGTCSRFQILLFMKQTVCC